MIIRSAAIVVLLVSAGFNIFFAFSTFRKKLTSGSGAYCLLLLSGTVYIIGYALELAGSTLEGIILALKFEYIGIAAFPVFWLLLAMYFSGKPRNVRTWMKAVLFIIPAITVVLVATNEFHHFYYSSIGLNPDSPFPLLMTEKGPWYYVHVGYMYGCVLAGNILFITVYREAAPPFRRQALLVMLASFIPWITNIIYLSGAVPYNFDVTSISLGITGPFLGITMAQMKTFRISPVARKLVFEDMADPVLVVSRKGFLADYNNAAERLFPSLNMKMLGSKVTSVVDIPHGLTEFSISEATMPHMLALRRGERTLHYQMRKTFMYAPSEKVEGMILTLTDMTAQVELQQRLEDLAARDGLTGVFNRRHFASLAEAEMGRSGRYDTPVSVIMLDLDHFKGINDTYGHDTGDRVLIKTAESLSKSLRSFDIIGRYGGEEFFIMLPETGFETAMVIAERLRQCLDEREIQTESTTIHVTASFGVAASPPTERSLASLITAADRALYRAKAGGRNRVEAG